MRLPRLLPSRIQRIFKTLLFLGIVAIATSVLAIGNDPFLPTLWYFTPAFVFTAVAIIWLLSLFILTGLLDEKYH